MADDTLPLFPGLDWKKYRIRRGFGPKTKRRPGPLVAVCKACGVAYYPYSKKEYGCSAYCSTVLMFWKDVEKTGTCWIWIGLKTPRGYGYIGTRDLDMLPGLKAEDSGCRENPVPFLFLRDCPRGHALGFRCTVSPLRGFYAGEATAYPRRSHCLSAGLTSRMPYGRGLDG